LALGLALMGVGALVFLTQAPWLAVALWCISGVGLALSTVGGASYLTQLNQEGALGMFAAFYALSMTIGGAIGNPLAGWLIDRRGFGIFGLATAALTAATVLFAALFLAHLQERTSVAASVRSWGQALLPAVLPAWQRTRVSLLVAMRALPTIFYSTLIVLIPLLLNDLLKSKTLVAAYGATNLIVASLAQLVVGRAADRWGARIPTLVAYATVVTAGLGLAVGANTAWGLFLFGVLGISAAWCLSTLMYLWVANGIPKADHASVFGFLHAVWSLSMIGGSLVGGWLVHGRPGLPFLAAGLLNIVSIMLTLAYYARIAAGNEAP
jgi:MFS family permease